MNGLGMNLKVCEGCGALWLRNNALKAVYCRACTVLLAEFPAPRARHAGGRRRLARAVGCSAAAVTAGGAR